MAHRKSPERTRRRVGEPNTPTRGPAWPWSGSSTLQAVWLLGQPPLERLLDEIEDYSVGGRLADPQPWVDAWRRANDIYLELERSEAGIANAGTHRELDPAYAERAAAVRIHPHFRQTFRHLPTTLGMVELDKLIVYQLHVTRNYVEQGIEALGSAPSPQAIADRCLPLHAPQAPVRIQRLDSHRYLFTSPSADLRLHDATLLAPNLLERHDSFGAIAGMVGVPVGFGCNFLNVIRVGNRHLLHNGYHRACALRAAGVTHAPCVIQTATRADELHALASKRVADDPSFYFESARPPLLKDFFDKRLCALIDLKPLVHQVEVRFEVKEYTAVDCS